MDFGDEEAGGDVGEGGDEDHGEEVEGCLEGGEVLDALEAGRAGSLDGSGWGEAVAYNNVGKY